MGKEGSEKLIQPGVGSFTWRVLPGIGLEIKIDN